MCIYSQNREAVISIVRSVIPFVLRETIPPRVHFILLIEALQPTFALQQQCKCAMYLFLKKKPKDVTVGEKSEDSQVMKNKETTVFEIQCGVQRPYTFSVRTNSQSQYHQKLSQFIQNFSDYPRISSKFVKSTLTLRSHSQM